MKRYVTILTRQKDLATDEIEQMELTTECEVVLADSSVYLTYQESALSGAAGTTTSLQIRNDSITLNRTGSTSSTLVFKEGERFTSDYLTPYGSVQMHIRTLDLLIEKTDIPFQLSISLKYDIIIRDLFEGINLLKIDINPL